MVPLIVLYDGMIELPHSDSPVRELWRSALQLLRAEGDFGPMDADVDLVHAWSRRDEAERLLFHLLRELTTPTLQLLNDALGDDAASVMYRGQKSVAVVWP